MFFILLRNKLQHVNWRKNYTYIQIHVFIISGRVRSSQLVLINLAQKHDIPSILELLSYLIECHFWMTCYSNISQTNIGMKCFHTHLSEEIRDLLYITPNSPFSDDQNSHTQSCTSMLVCAPLVR